MLWIDQEVGNCVWPEIGNHSRKLDKIQEWRSKLSQNTFPLVLQCNLCGFVLVLLLSGLNIRKGDLPHCQKDLFSNVLSHKSYFCWSLVHLSHKIYCSTLKEHDLDVVLILLRLCKNPVLVTLWVQKQVSNYIFCVRWKKKLFWRYKLWLSWKQCVILAWRSHTWVAQTCESAKQTTQIASAVTIWERSWTLFFFIPWRVAIWSTLLFCKCISQIGLSSSVSSRSQSNEEGEIGYVMNNTITSNWICCISGLRERCWAGGSQLKLLSFSTLHLYKVQHGNLCLFISWHFFRNNVHLPCNYAVSLALFHLPHECPSNTMLQVN